MQAVVCEGRSDGLVALADEFMEDPRCLLVVAGADDSGVVVVTLWEDELGDEVAAGLSDHPAVDVARVLAVPDGAAHWS
jgi:hypothetical protein